MDYLCSILLTQWVIYIYNPYIICNPHNIIDNQYGCILYTFFSIWSFSLKMQRGIQIFLLFRLDSTPFIGHQELCSALRIKNGAPAFKELCGDGVNRGVNTEYFTFSLVKVGKEPWAYK